MNTWWLRLAKISLQQWTPLVLVILLMLASVGFTVLQPWPMKLLVDCVFVSLPLPQSVGWLQELPGARSATGLLAWLAVATLVLFSAGWLTQTLQAYLQSGMAIRMTYGLGARVFEHLQRLSLRYHSRQPTGDLVRRVTRDSRCARDLVLDVVAPLVTAVSTLLVMFFIMWQLNVTLTLVALVVAPAIAVAQWWYYRPMVERTYDQQRWEGEMMSQAEQVLTAMPVIQAFRREPIENQRFRDAAANTLNAYFRALVAQLKFRLSVQSSTAVGRALILVVGGTFVWQGSLTLGSLLVFLAYLDSLYAPLETLGHMTASLANTEACAKRVFEVLDSEDFVPCVENDVSPDVSLPSKWTGRIRFEDVSFGYQPQQLVLQGVNLDIQPGETIALVGKTGAGKTTLVSLMMRFFDPTSGSIYLDEFDLKSIPISVLRSQISILLQEPFLLPVSIAENIAYGRPDATSEQIEAAARTANAHEFIARLPEGYQTQLGQRGITLSGGERQRIAIARALLKDAPILILDEPTAALDTQTESSLVNALQRLMTGRTTIVIAHRMSTIQNADRVVTLSGSVEIDGNGEHLSRWSSCNLSETSKDGKTLV